MIIKSKANKKSMFIPALMLVNMTVGLLAPLIPLKMLLLLIVCIVLFFIVQRYPEIGIVLCIYAGRFRNIPYFDENMPDYIYVSTFIIAFTLIVSFLRQDKQVGETTKTYNISIEGTLSILFAAVLLFGLTYSPSSYYGAQKTIEYIFYTMTIFFLTFKNVIDEKRLKRLIFAMFILSTFFAVSGIISLLLNGMENAGRMAVFGGGPNVFSRFTSLGALVGFNFLYQGCRHKKIVLPALLLLFLATFLSGSRGSFIGLILASLLFLFAALYTKNKNKFMFLIKFLICMLLVIAIASLFLYMDSSITSRFSLLLSQDKGGSVNIRYNDILNCFSLAENKIVFGYGTGAFAPMFYSQDVKSYPHNIFAEIIFENGLIGISLLLFFILAALKKGIMGLRKLPWRNYSILILTCFVYSLIVAQFSGDLYDSRFIWFFSALIISLNKMNIGEQVEYPSKLTP